jgi:hypothetical protein
LLISETIFSLVRIRRQADGERLELALIRSLRPLIRTDEPYRILCQAVAPGGLTAEEINRLKRRHHNLGRTLALLTREKLVVAAGDGYNATPDGRRLVAGVRHGVGGRAPSPLVRCRLILVEDDPVLDLGAVEETLGEHGEVVRSEGAYVRLAVVPDDFELAETLLSKIRTLGAHARVTRLIG